MDARIAFVCYVAHANEEREGVAPLITMIGRKWAYCPRGGSSDHEWQEIEPTSLGWLRIGRAGAAGVARESQRPR